jgi:hypothetical protein
MHEAFNPRGFGQLGFDLSRSASVTDGSSMEGGEYKKGNVQSSSNVSLEKNESRAVKHSCFKPNCDGFSQAGRH